MTRAQAAVEELRKQVEEGVAPRIKLVQALESLADVQDGVVLQRTLYGEAEIGDDRIEEMIAAARRRMERRHVKIAEQRKLIEEGGAPRLSMSEPLEQFDFARREYDLAVSRGKFVRELVEIAEAEQAFESPTDVSIGGPVMERFDGSGTLVTGDVHRLELAFEMKFSKPLPVSARGETAIHRKLGFDHRNRVDVAVHPDEPEGIWLRQYLTSENIPYYSFRRFVPGKATGAHIHIGPASTRVAKGG
ncbi:MAG: hypothetical protein ACRD8O_11825 [Bryobacteraceae bacterium]